MRHFPPIAVLSLLFTAFLSPLATAQAPERSRSPSPAEQRLEQAAAEQKYAFLLFYKQNDAATQAAVKILSHAATTRKDRAIVLYIHVASAGERALVEKYKTARAPLPLTLALAPNGATTGVFQKLEARHIDESFVTPATADCMKALQAGKTVLLCVHPTAEGVAPAGVEDFLSDPEFASRASVVSMRLDDEAERSFLGDLEIDPMKTRGTTVVFMAPPGVMVGKYAAAVTKEKLVADLHAAGKCCDDPNCKHGKAK